ncbi:MAG: monofunctional biosynthetic peptidoglycan transglycosylase [Alphaproteobacteria bacterium]|nr:MAG: monofunctional biosynthetic peptidoglycan transglycosylase [Caulobacteraceae bacterium]TPW08262.1 MAG: monofunctional biosynthetic peptidoglycan transglycosylase [Alphaproteobacteria bacterium]
MSNEDFPGPEPTPPPERRRPNWFVRLAALGLVVTVVIPVLWVLVYGIIEAPGTLLMAQRAAQGEEIRHRTVPLSRISPHLVRAVIAAEDAKFCSHQGFDVEAINKAVKYNERAKNRGSKKRRGASTISQQTAKNLFLWPQRSWVRKGLEVYFTGLIEIVWPKRRIMEAYLNAAEWGDGIFGAEAAARARFGKSASELTPREAARLAAVLPSPNKWNPVSPGRYVQRRAGAIQANMNIVRNEGLAACVLGKERVTTRPGRRRPTAPVELPPLPAPPPELAPPEEGAPVEIVAPLPEGAPISTEPPAGEETPVIEDLPAETPAEPPPEAPPATPSP